MREPIIDLREPIIVLREPIIDLREPTLDKQDKTFAEKNGGRLRKPWAHLVLPGSASGKNTGQEIASA